MKKNLILLVVSTLISAIVVTGLSEIYCRIIASEAREERSLHYVPSLFSRHVFPEKELVADGWDGTEYHINKRGYRGEAFATEKDEKTIRLIIYGGSFVFDPAAPEGLSWPHRVAKLLNERGIGNVEVINAGIPGHASWDCVGRFFSEGHLFCPDYVLLCTAWNDIKDFRSEKPLLRQHRPYGPRKNPRLTYWASVDRFLSRNSKLYLRIRDPYCRLKLRLGTEGRKPSDRCVSMISSLALQQYRLNVQTLVDLVRNAGSVPILMTQSRLVARNNTEQQKRRINYDYQLLTHETLCEAFERIDGIVHDVARAKNVSVIDASSAMTGKDEFFRDHVHLTEKGSQELSRITADQMERLLAGGGIL